MKFLITLLAAVVAAVPVPQEQPAHLEARGPPIKPSAGNPKLIPKTDELVFSVPLETFVAQRSRKTPAALDFASDNCTKSPDNPLGFPFAPCCQRHDFGYQNFQAQGRFTARNKKKIDDNFVKDLKHQCATVKADGKKACNALAVVYHAAVRVFGGRKAIQGKQRATATVASAELMADYEEKLAAYQTLEAEYKLIQAREASPRPGRDYTIDGKDNV